ncbi:hypothetical protein VC83_04326 [Pseudogymnoascus destructans]|uniref:Uncharacterized protein n=2 Tax=Pseudogymnoascus destructans TaxID=655981 RepID=L8GBX0_PSED2|nr:uncharacterized protein VC83_04326 [Pseudogymnoascus destructans]ELR10133.1 hypothetical protein GMDG_04529 [Pseudogymnoascus destructans 20631-21]OAF59146.1 hypothetical protein VC83_04326 [Pseudogymnoascus destructans]
MSNLTTLPTLTTTGGPTFPTYTFTNSSLSSTHIRTTTDTHGDVETITDITVVQPTDASSTTSTTSTSSSAPLGTSAGEKVRLGMGAWVVALLAVSVGMGFM